MNRDDEWLIHPDSPILSPFRKCSSCTHWVVLSVTLKDAYCKLGCAETCITNNRSFWRSILRPVYPDFIKKEEMMI